MKPRRALKWVYSSTLNTCTKMFEIEEPPPPKTRKYEEYHIADWDTRETLFKEEIIRKAIKEGLTPKI